MKGRSHISHANSCGRNQTTKCAKMPPLNRSPVSFCQPCVKLIGFTTAVQAQQRGPSVMGLTQILWYPFSAKNGHFHLPGAGTHLFVKGSVLLEDRRVRQGHRKSAPRDNWP